ncbi:MULTISPECIES: DUF1642 domain-containing protein [Enterococcus]|uniref:DUF1642 domain-containing protein n=2 Tax=root TaxID=1 RepID=A0A8S5TLL5_9CAUD|nr:MULTISPECIES: DUF1642 domain-containing protein [Enterococcus]EGP5395904.1 DUF1642 domain-containing protein [Enterococcus faecium]MXS06664.1 DUF1642 domain-containing protein [Enterococcus faecium]OFP97399.1 hypothetical protein HMPREF2961_01905 [Enterococcus sp. HMSC076E04]DAF64181.1 MAG TPA: Protein of unknown function (DUF1642) [Siphoviridae sp. ctKgQ2]
MNKQETIKKLESIKAIGNDAIAACYNESINAGITLMKKIDEPQKPVVPKFVAEWIEYAKKKGDSLAISFKPWNLYGVEYSKADRWIEDNQETFARAWIDGYEVEKEPLYYVKLPVMYFNRWDLEAYLMKDDRGNITIADNNDFDDMKFTESEIKAIDEGYWPFAVPV